MYVVYINIKSEAENSDNEIIIRQRLWKKSNFCNHGNLMVNAASGKLFQLEYPASRNISKLIMI